MYTLAIADDEPVIRESLASLIDWGELGFAVAAVVSDGEELIPLVDSGKIDVVLTDIKMTQTSGLDVAAHVQERGLPTLVVLLSGYREFELARQAIKYNVCRYLLKPISLSDVTELFTELRRKLAEAEKTGAEPSPEQEPEQSARAARQDSFAADAVGRVKAEVIRRSSENLPLRKLAAEVGLSYSYLSRLFKETTGEKYIDFVTRVKIERAKELLSEPGGGTYIREISDSLGYNNTKYFFRLFKRATGMTPNEYRGSVGLSELPDGGSEAET